MIIMEIRGSDDALALKDRLINNLKFYGFVELLGGVEVGFNIV